MSESGPLVLDTHVWIWLNFGTPGLKPLVRRSIDEAAGRGDLRLPAICPWEVALLTSKRRLELYLPVRDWVHRALAVPGLSLAPVTPDIAVEACYLPGDFHGDPADRLIVATARVEGATLVTRDAGIVAYGRAGHLSVLAA